MTACAPLCGLSAIRKVTSRRSPQTQLCPKRVTGVHHPANSAQPKVAGEPGGRKKCRIKRGGRKRPSARETPPRRAGRGRSGGGHFSPPGVNSGVCFHKKPAVARFSRDLGGDIYEFQEEHHAKRKNSSSRCEFPLRRSNSSKRCVFGTTAVHKTSSSRRPSGSTPDTSQAKRPPLISHPRWRLSCAVRFRIRRTASAVCSSSWRWSRTW